MSTNQQIPDETPNDVREAFKKEIQEACQIISHLTIEVKRHRMENNLEPIQAQRQAWDFLNKHHYFGS